MSAYAVKGQQISMTGHSHPIQQGAYGMDPSFGHVGRCQKLGCNEVDVGQAVFCKSHDLGQRCQMFGCPQIVSDGLALCISHGGCCPRGDTGSSVVVGTTSEAPIKNEGDRFKNTGTSADALNSAGIYNANGEVVTCKHEGCSKRAQGNTMFCKVHSGVSKRCMVQGCTKGAHGGTPLCIGHGGGKRCIVTGCPNAACGSSQGRSDCCVRHGGGRRCNYDGCRKGAQGSTDFCIAHGGGRRCKYEGCGKSAQGRTDYCIKHGGGRRCMFQGCSTSAKWGKDLCSVHRKSLSRSNSVNEVPPAPPLKRRAKKAKITVETPGSSKEVITMSAIPRSGMAKMSVIHVAAAGPGHDKLPESSTMKHATIAHLHPLQQSSTEPSPLGFQLHGFNQQ